MSYPQIDYIYDSLRQSELAYHYFLSYVRLLPPASSEFSKAVQELIVMALRSSSLLEFGSLFSLHEINVLEVHFSKDLLKILTSYELASYLSWESLNEDFFRKYGSAHILSDSCLN